MNCRNRGKIGIKFIPGYFKKLKYVDAALILSKRVLTTTLAWCQEYQNERNNESGPVCENRPNPMTDG